MEFGEPWEPAHRMIDRSQQTPCLLLDEALKTDWTVTLLSGNEQTFGQQSRCADNNGGLVILGINTVVRSAVDIKLVGANDFDRYFCHTSRIDLRIQSQLGRRTAC